MSLITTSILMLFLQPLFVYLALFKESEQSARNRSLDNEDAMYLFIAPGLAVFYSEDFWQADTLFRKCMPTRFNARHYCKKQS